MPLSAVEAYAKLQTRFDGERLADLITGVNLGSHGKASEIKRLLKQLRDG